MKINKIIFAVFLWLLLAIGARAQFNYTINNGKVTINYYNGISVGPVAIPSTIAGYPITTIGPSAFAGCSGLSSITIPNSVTTIGDGAFQFCLSLTNMTIPDGVINIAEYAFYECMGLTNVTIGKNATNMGYDVFWGCTGLINIRVDTNNPVYSSVDGILFNRSKMSLIQYPTGSATSNYTIPAGVTNIGADAFANCTNLTDIIVPNGVTSIANGAFSYCPKLASMTLPNSVTTLGGFAFSYCGSLTNAAIGSGVTNIGEFAFHESTNLSSLEVDEANPAYCSVNGVLFDRSQGCLIKYPAASVVTNYLIPNSVTNIGSDAFSYCANLTGVTIPKNVTSIGNESFSFCSSLTTIVIPSSVSVIENYAFQYCTGLAYVYFQGNAPSDNGVAFSADYLATVYYLPGTTNWNSTFSGRPTVRWNPQLQTGDISFGAQPNQFGFTITGTTNIPVMVEASTNFSSAWVPLQSVNLTNGSFYFSDPQWTNYPNRFYRIRSP